MALIYQLYSQLSTSIDISLIQVLIVTFILIALINWFVTVKSLPPGPLAFPLIGTYKSTF